MTAINIADDGARRPEERLVDSNDAFDGALAAYRPFIQRKARVLAGGDTLLEDEMIQIGRIALWELDPSRLMPGDKTFVRTRIASRMRDLRRHEESVIGGALRVEVPDDCEAW